MTKPLDEHRTQSLVRVKFPVRTRVGRRLTAPAASGLERLLGLALREPQPETAGEGLS